MTSEHPQVKVEHPLLGTVGVDEDLVSLFTTLWEHDINTLLSCQENASPDYPRPMVWILFLEAIGAEGFLTRIRPEFSDEPWSLYQRMRHDAHSDSWAYTPHLEDIHTQFGTSDLFWTEVPTKAYPEFVFQMSIRFPLEDLPAVKAAFDV